MAEDAPQGTPEVFGKFKTGDIVITKNALECISCDEAFAAFALHIAADWGEQTEDGGEANDLAQKEGRNLRSVCLTEAGVTFHIITKADRSCTTIQLPEDN